MSIIRIDPSFDTLVPRDAQIEKVAGGLHIHGGAAVAAVRRLVVQRRRRQRRAAMVA